MNFANSSLNFKGKTADFESLNLTLQEIVEVIEAGTIIREDNNNKELTEQDKQIIISKNN